MDQVSRVTICGIDDSRCSPTIPWRTREGDKGIPLRLRVLEIESGKVESDRAQKASLPIYDGVFPTRIPIARVDVENPHREGLDPDLLPPGSSGLFHGW